MNPIEVFEEVQKIIDPVFMVGGCVRDYILEREPHDYDFCTPLSPTEIEKRIRSCGRRPYLVGKKFGTVGVKIQDKNNISTFVEITTFRTEKYENGSRKPIVEFVPKIEQDLGRRDFTINALAMKTSGKILDFHGGKQDIKDRIIRCVGNPKHRFVEDPLRMLRAARFSSQLDFIIDPDISNTVKAINHKILKISKERWVSELDKMLISDKPRNGLEFLFENRVMNFIIPELSLQYNYKQDNPNHSHVLHEHTIRVVENVPKDINVRWAALLHDIAKPFLRQYKENPTRCVYYKHELLGVEFIEKISRYLKWSNARTKLVSNMVLEHMKEGSVFKEADMDAK